MRPHTPTPWSVRVLRADDPESDCFVMGAKPVGATIAGTYNREVMSDERYPEKRGDAELIISAVNGFAELRGALIDLNAAVAAWRVTGTPDLSWLTKAQNRADEALKATDGPA
jgi:hypothetical protein